MKLLVTGVCGFAGSSLATELPQRIEGLEVIGLDNLSRPGSEVNRQALRQRGIRLFHGDLRNPSDLEALPAVDWVIDAAANPSVLAGVRGSTSSRQLLEHNLSGTLHLLEYCKRHRAGIVLLSTSRVYSLQALSALPMEVIRGGFGPRLTATAQAGMSAEGITEGFPTTPPLSLYGAAKLASEVIALEYGLAFDFPVRVNRCGVLAGAGQFGRPDQGIFTFWIHSYRWKQPLRYIGFDGSGHQVRDCLHPGDLATLVALQLNDPRAGESILNVSGGTGNALSLVQLSAWCADRFGRHRIDSDLEQRPYDVPWLVLDSRRAHERWGWRPARPITDILEEIARHADDNPGWLELSREP